MNMPVEESKVAPGVEAVQQDQQDGLRQTPSTVSLEQAKRTRKRDFGFLPIPKSRRYDPSMKPEECFPWSLRMNLVFASAAVRHACSIKLYRTDR